MKILRAYPLLTIFLLGLLVSRQAFAQKIDLAVSQKVSNSMPSLGDTLSFIVTLKNEGTRIATGISVKNQTPLGMINISGITASKGTQTYNATNGEISWQISSLNIGESVHLTIKIQTLIEGIHYNIASITAAAQQDEDSNPSNFNSAEDDVTTACFSTPVAWFQDDQVYLNINKTLLDSAKLNWYKNGEQINGVILGAQITKDGIQVSKPGIYSYTVGSSTCKTCCALVVEEARFGSIGDYIWNDTNKDGIQDATEAGIPGISVCLENSKDQMASNTVTDAKGKYTFFNVNPGEYKVVVSKPEGYVFSPKKQSSNDNLDSDVDINDGKTGRFPVVARSAFTNKDAGMFFNSNCFVINTITKSDSAICIGQSTTLTAISSNASKINWYHAANGDSLLFSTNSGEGKVVTPSITTTYYAALAFVDAGCPNVRKSLIVSISTQPEVPIALPTTEVCSGTLVDLNSLITSTTIGKFEWHISNIITSNKVSNPSAVGPGDYYVFNVINSNCTSQAAKVTISNKTCGSDIADLSLVKLADKRIVGKNGIVQYTIELSNAGPKLATNVTIEDKIPAGLQFISGTGFTNNNGTLTAIIDTVLTGEKITLSYTAKVTIDSGTVLNIAQVKSVNQTDPDSRPGNRDSANEDDDDDEAISIQKAGINADLSLKKTVADSSLSVGESITYTIQIHNAGPDIASNIKVKDVLPTGISNITFSGADSMYKAQHDLHAIFNSLAVNETRALIVKATASSLGTLINTAAIIAADQKDPDSSPDITTKEDDNDAVSITVTGGCTVLVPIITTSNPSICLGGSANLFASGCNGTVQWSNGMTGTTISVNPSQTITYTAQCSVGSCLSNPSNSLSISVQQITAPTVVADKSIICPGDSIKLTASNCSGKINWSNGLIGNAIIVKPLLQTNYTATCSSAGCTSLTSSPITIKTSASPPKLSASATAICLGESVTILASQCEGTVIWSNGVTGDQLSVSPTVTTNYWAKCSNGTCPSSNSDTLKIAVGTQQNPLVVVSADTICSGNSVTLTASNCFGNILWNSGQNTSSITVKPLSNTTYSVSCGAASCVGSASKTIFVKALAVPAITASVLSICEPDTVMLSATGCNGTVIWSNGKTGSIINEIMAATSSFTATCSTSTCTSIASNSIQIVVGELAKPVISASGNKVCNESGSTITAAGCSGTISWSDGQTGTAITVTPKVKTVYTAVCKNGSCTSGSSNPIEIEIITTPTIPTISANATLVCSGQSLTFLATGCEGLVKWNTGQSGNTIDVSPTVTTDYSATCVVGTCQSVVSAVLQIKVGRPTAPIVSALENNICQGNSVKLSATGCTASVRWSDGQTGALINVLSTQNKTYKAVCINGVCASDSSASLTLTVKPNALNAPVTRALNNICPLSSVNLNNGVLSTKAATANSFVFKTANSTNAPNVVGPDSIKNNGTYFVFEMGANGCFSPGGQIDVAIISCSTTVNCTTSPATVNAEGDKAICLKEDFFPISGTIGGAAQTATWTSNGSGRFENSTLLTTKYFPSSQDIDRGSITFRLTTNDPDNTGACPMAVDSFRVLIDAVKTRPTASTNIAQNICLGDSIQLTANETANNYIWSNGATTKSIFVKLSGNYSVQLVNVNGCRSLSSTPIEVTTNNGLSAPTVNALAKNICPETTVNLGNFVTSQPLSSGSVFEYHTGNSKNSPVVHNASAILAQGEYYVYEKSAIGCYSSPSKITVSLDKCDSASAGTADVSINIIGDKSSASIGNFVNYIVTVKNNGPSKATNIYTEIKLPAGFRVSNLSGLTQNGDFLITTITSLAVGENKTFTYKGLILNTGVISNIAQIIALNEVDPKKSNNISQHDVECLTCQEICIGNSLDAETEEQTDGKYKVTFTSLVENCGNTELKGVTLRLNMKKMFGDTVVYTMIQQPIANKGSKLIPNIAYNGSSAVDVFIKNGSSLTAGETDTVKWVILISPNGKKGPFRANSTAAGEAETNFSAMFDVNDISNDGQFIDRFMATPTVIRLFKTPEIGLSLAIIDTARQQDGTINVTYQAILKNNGKLNLTNVILTDSLVLTYFTPVAYLIVKKPTLNAGSQLVLNPDFNGHSKPTITLDSSKLAVNKTDTIRFTVNVKPKDKSEFSNQAIVNAKGTLESGTSESVSDLSNNGTNPDAPGHKPTILNLSGPASENKGCIGLAFHVAAVTKQTNGTYDVNYKAILKNCGNVELHTVSLCEPAYSGFDSTVVITLKSKPTANSGSKLALNDAFDGKLHSCLLKADSSALPLNKIDTVSWTINVKLDTIKGPYNKNLETKAKTPQGKTISDISNDGVEPDVPGNLPTTTYFTELADRKIGISKKLTNIRAIGGSIYDVTFTFVLKNFGKTDLDSVLVQDDLRETFGSKVAIDSVAIFDLSAGLVADTTYTGRDSLTNLLKRGSKLPKNTTRNFSLFTRLNVAGSDTIRFENLALAEGRSGGKKTNDLSTVGLNPDPDFDGKPENNSVPTLIDFGIISGPTFETSLGISKLVADTVAIVDGSYQITYKVIVKNYGADTLKNVQLTDSLSNVFKDSTQFGVVGVITRNDSSILKLNSGFNGVKDNKMLAAGNLLIPGQSDTLIFKVKVRNNSSSPKTYNNVITGTATAGTEIVTELSQDGLNPDPDGDGNPGNNNENTPLTLISGKNNSNGGVFMSIQEGLSPNGDGKNDKLVINGISEADNISFKVFNRWGEMVFLSKNYKADFPGLANGWDGTSNTGIRLDDGSGILPDGTYFIVLESANTDLLDNKPFITFITLWGGSKN